MMPSTILQTNFPNNISCLTTPRYLLGAYGMGSYDNFNLATHTGDKLDLVAKNRQLLLETYQLPSEPKWLNQTHSTCCLPAEKINNIPNADASWTTKKGVVCVVLTADCLPIFISNKQGSSVGVIHAGYQGLLNGVIESFIKTSPIKLEDMLVHFGVGISQMALPLDEKMMMLFIKKQASFASAFKQEKNQYFLNMALLAEVIFNQNDIWHISKSQGCTYQEKNKYFSYRRQGANSGRMAHLIWFK